MTTPPNGRSQLVLNILLGVLATALLSFCAWLALVVSKIDRSLAVVERDIASLVETRRDQTQERRQNVGERLDRIEGRPKQ